MRRTERKENRKNETKQTKTDQRMRRRKHKEEEQEKMRSKQTKTDERINEEKDKEKNQTQKGGGVIGNCLKKEEENKHSPKSKQGQRSKKERGNNKHRKLQRASLCPLLRGGLCIRKDDKARAVGLYNVHSTQQTSKIRYFKNLQ